MQRVHTLNWYELNSIAFKSSTSATKMRLDSDVKFVLDLMRY